MVIDLFWRLLCMTMLIAHRGWVGDISLIEKSWRDLRGLFGSWFIGENSLDSIEWSLRTVDAVEIDIQQSKSWELIVIHDVTLDRTTDGEWSVNDMDYDQIDDYFTRSGQRVPLLKKVLESVLPQKKILIDLKWSFDDEALFRFFDSLYFQVFSDNILVQSFDKNLLMRLRYRYFDMKLIYLCLFVWKRELRFLDAIDGYALHTWDKPLLYAYSLWKKNIDDFVNQWWRIWTRTVDEPQNIKFFQEKWFWSIISNTAHLYQ